MWRKMLSLSCIFFLFSAQAQLTSKAQPVEMLFSLSGKTAHLQYRMKNQFKIIVDNVNSDVIFFSNRPIREAGHIKLQDFLTLWYQPGANSFANIAPNIVIQGKNQQGKLFNYVFVMSRPVFHSSQQQLIFTANPIGKSILPLSLKLSAVAVFIDGYWGGGLG